MKTKKIISMLLVVVLLLGALPLSAFAADWGEGDTLEDALSELKVGFDDKLLDWLVLPNLGVIYQRYAYFHFTNERTGTVDQHPVYCIDPTKGGAYEIVQAVGPNDDGSKTATYIRGDKVGDTKYKAILAAGYPHMRLTGLGLQTIEEGYYATKLALWMYIRGNDPTKLTINPKYGSSDPVALRVYNAAVSIYNAGTKGSSPNAPALTLTAKSGSTAKLDANGQYYVQEVEVYTSGWIGTNSAASGDVQLSWQSPPPAGTIVLGSNGENITSTLNVVMTQSNGMYGKITIKYPASEVDAETYAPPTLKATAIVPNDEIYIAYAKAGKDKYQRYLVERDPKIELTAAFVSQFGVLPSDEDAPEGTGLRIRKVETGTNTPLVGAVFEVLDPDGRMIYSMATGDSGIIDIPLAVVGNYTVTEVTPPQYHSLSEKRTQNITVRYGEVAEVTFANAPYGALRVVKRDAADGTPLGGAAVRIRNLTTNTTQEMRTDSSGSAYFDKLPTGAYKILEIASPEGYALDSTAHTVNVRPMSEGETSYILLNKANPGLRITKFDKQTMMPIADVTFEVWRDGELYGTYVTDDWGEITLHNISAGTYRAKEVTTRDGYVLDPTEQWIEIRAGQGYIAELVFFNLTKPNLTIRKVDSVTGSPVKGALFQVWGEVSGSLSGELRDLGKYYSDEKGEIILNNQEVGWVRVQELEPAAGYSIKDPSSQDVFLEAGKDKTVTFENVPLSALIIRKIDSDTGLPVQGAAFRVRYLGGTSGSGGTIIFDGVTSTSGSIVLTGLKAGTYIAEEYRAANGYELSNPSTKTAYLSGKDQGVVELVFENAHKGSLIIKKLDSVTKQPLAGVTFKVTDSSDAVIGPNNGEYTTDASGLINIGENLPVGSTVIVQEIKAPDTHILDTTAQSIKIKENTTHTLTFYNTPKGGLQILKLDEETRRPIAGVEFRVAKMNGEVIGTFRTDSNGLIHIPVAVSGWFAATETKSAKGYLLDDTVHTIEVKDGKTAVLTVTNRKTSGIIIHKVDSITGKGIPGVTFLLYDTSNNPLGQYESDQDGYVYIGAGLEDGKYKIRELQPASGYIGDEQVRTVYLEYGKTTEIKWENSRELGQIIITKRSAQFNETTNLPAGSPLSGAVFEVCSLSGNLVARMVSDAKGVAASSPILLGVYIVKEVSPPKYYALNPREFVAELRHNGDIVRFEVLDENVTLGVTVQKKSQNQIVQNQMILWDLFNVANTSSAVLENFYLHDRLPTDAVRGAKVFTGTWSHPLTYRVTYKTNYASDYRVLASGLSTKTDYELSIHPNVLGLQSGEYVTDIRWEFGTVPAGFQSVTNPRIQAQVLATLPKGYKIINRADVGGLYIGQWLTAQTSWTTLIYSDPAPAPQLPKTGY